MASKIDLLLISQNAVQEIRKIHNLDKPERMEEAVDILEQWVKKQDHFLKKDFSRAYLEKTIITCKGSVEKAKKQIDRLCTLKTLLPNYFSKTNVRLQLKEIVDMAWLTPLPIITKDFYRVLVIKIIDKPITESVFMDYFRYNIILCEYLKAHDYVNGFLVVNDYQQKNVMEIIKKINVVHLQQAMSIFTEGFGARLKGIHILTQSTVIDILVKLMKQIMSQKIGGRIHLYKTLEELHTVVPREILPEEYGGNERSMAELMDAWLDELSSEEHVNYMTMMNQAKTDEKFRRSDKFNDEYMGMPGAFRNLRVD